MPPSATGRPRVAGAGLAAVVRRHAVAVVVGLVGAVVGARAVARGDAPQSRESFKRRSAEAAGDVKLAIERERDLLISASAFLVQNPSATKPVVIDCSSHTTVSVSASISIAVGQPARAKELLHDSDLALYAAKQDRKDRYFVFDQDMQAAASEGLPLGFDLANALEAEQFAGQSLRASRSSLVGLVLPGPGA